MAATMKLSITFVFVLLLSGLVVFGDAAATCETVRCKPGGYITCRNKNYRKTKLDGCACVCAPKDGKGCVLHHSDGTKTNCATTSNY